MISDIAHHDAYTNAKVLHRDISMGNILINIDKEEAFLNDWDLCKYRGEMDSVASQNTRSVRIFRVSVPGMINDSAFSGDVAVHVCSIDALPS